MQHESHPHDERLAALAGADPEATGDRGLREHVAACERCRAMVDDLSLLRSALADLPDLRPSRPLRLLPPVAERRAAGGAFGLLRRLSAPAMAVGVVLILVGAAGAVGTAGGTQALFSNVRSELGADEEAAPSEAPAPWWEGLFGGFGAASGASPGSLRGSSEGNTDSVSPAAAPGGSTSESFASPAPSDEDGFEDQGGPVSALNDPEPQGGRLVWVVLVVLGALVAGGGLLLRFAVQPRAG